MLGPAARTNTALLSSGAVLIQNMILPDALKIETSIYSRNWRVVDTLGGSWSVGSEQSAAGTILETKIRAVGWNFFFMAGKMEGSA